MEQIRQGDVLLIAVDKQPPSGVLPRQEVVLAEGELTGHAHKVRAKTILEWSEGSQRYIRIMGTQAGELYHEDHDPVAVAVLAPETTYQIISQQEWSLKAQWHRVVD